MKERLYAQEGRKEKKVQMRTFSQKVAVYLVLMEIHSTRIGNSTKIKIKKYAKFYLGKTNGKSIHAFHMIYLTIQSV